MKIWIVEGRCGEYSDRQEWSVAWHRTEEAAMAHRDQLAGDVAAVPETAWYELRWENEAAFRRLLPKDDQVWDSRTTYSIYPLEEGP